MDAVDARPLTHPAIHLAAMAPAGCRHPGKPAVCFRRTAAGIGKEPRRTVAGTGKRRLHGMRRHRWRRCPPLGSGFRHRGGTVFCAISLHFYVSVYSRMSLPKIEQRKPPYRNVCIPDIVGSNDPLAGIIPAKSRGVPDLLDLIVACFELSTR